MPSHEESGGSNLLIAQLSDLHISTPGSENDRFFKTPEHLERAVGHLNGLSPRPDLVLVTGDLVERGHADEYRRLRRMLDMLTMPYFVIPGNHDDRRALREGFADHRYLRSDSAFIHYVVEGWAVRLIALDTVIPG